MSENEVNTLLEVMPVVHKILEPSMNPEARFIRDYRTLALVTQVLRSMGKKIVMTKGVYDMLHVGHVRYISDAKQNGDILVVSIDTDELTRSRKGPRRPVVPEDERLEMLLHLRYVDIITFRSGKPEEEEEDIAAVRPHVLVTSESTKDYTDAKKEHLREAYGVEIQTLSPRAETSTTARIRTLMIDGAEELGQEVSRVVSEFLRKLGG